MNYYDNGELITKNRMEDEDWYYKHYQTFLELLYMGDIEEDLEKITIENVQENYLKKYKEIYSEESDVEPDRLFKWCILHAERLKSLPSKLKEFKERNNIEE